MAELQFEAPAEGELAEIVHSGVAIGCVISSSMSDLFDVAIYYYEFQDAANCQLECLYRVFTLEVVVSELLRPNFR